MVAGDEMKGTGSDWFAPRDCGSSTASKEKFLVTVLEVG